MQDCWHQDALRRPAFVVILQRLNSMSLDDDYEQREPSLSPAKELQMNVSFRQRMGLATPLLEDYPRFGIGESDAKWMTSICNV